MIAKRVQEKLDYYQLEYQKAKERSSIIDQIYLKEIITLLRYLLGEK
jgi:hypothetical protein